MQLAKWFIVLGGINAMLTVILGAFVAHRHVTRRSFGTTKFLSRSLPCICKRRRRDRAEF